MIKHTDNIQKGNSGAFLMIFFSFCILGVAFFGIFGQAKTAQGANNYVDNVYIWLDEHYYWRLHFHVKATFTITYETPGACNLGETTKRSQTSFTYGLLPSDSYGANPTHEWHAWHNGALEYTAGNSYDIFLTRAGKWGTGAIQGKRRNDVCSCGSSDYDCNYKVFYLLNKRGGQAYFDPPENYTFRLTSFGDPQINDPEEYPIFLIPQLQITYPFDNAEMVGAFNITGTYEQVDLGQYSYLVAYIGDNYNNYYITKQKLNATSGNVDIKITGIPAGDYTLFFNFVSADNLNAYSPGCALSIKIVDDILFELPITNEKPPDFFSLYSASYIYSEHSNYATPTAMFSTLTGAIEPIITTLGDNLTFFTSQFEQSKAKQTGQKIGNAILIVRAYAGNLNSFFNDLPVAEVLFFYLLLLVVVVVFRIIRQAISLIPFT